MASVAVGLCACSGPVGAESPPATETQESVAADLKALDARLFEAAFETCDMDTLTSLIATDMEFYHDRDGLSYTSAKAFIGDVEGECGGGKRVLVSGSLTTHMIGDFGAMQHGRHEFHQVMGDGGSVAREKGVFMHMWKRAPETDANWVLTRVVSYDHEGM
ncbi:MAG: nuclear transport factor 2 family protein [Pseudomonadota bacterium]